MAGGYLTDNGFVEDTKPKTIPKEAPSDSVCGSAILPVQPSAPKPQDELGVE